MRRSPFLKKEKNGFTSRSWGPRSRWQILTRPPASRISYLRIVFFFLLGSNGCYRVALDIARFSWSFQSVRGTDLRTTQWSLGARNCFIQQCRFNDEEVWPETKANDRTVEFTSRFACFYCIQSELCEPMLIKEIVEISFRGAKCKEVLPWKRSWLSPTLIKHWMRGFSNNALFHLEYL